MMPPQAVNDVLYKKPDDARCYVLKKVKTENGTMRKVFRGELSDMKKRKRRDDSRDEAKKMLQQIVRG